MQNAQFDLSHLRCFVAVAEELHFGRAAQRLNMTQPPLSRQIQVLERILDVTLLERTSRMVQLTRAGASFLPEAQRILRQTDLAVAIARRVDSGKIGTLRIGFTAATVYSFLPSLVTACQIQLPEIGLVLNEMVTKDQIEALLSGQLDIGLMRPPISRSELSSLEAETVTAEDLHGEPFIMYSSLDARYFHDVLVSHFAETGVLPRYVQHLVQIHSILALVRAGVGVTLAPASAAALRYEGVVFKPFKSASPKMIELYLVWRRDIDNPLVRHVVELAEQSAPAGQAPRRPTTNPTEPA
jgi:DNA-binding transcriptional LysR family regulator